MPSHRPRRLLGLHSAFMVLCVANAVAGATFTSTARVDRGRDRVRFVDARIAKPGSPESAGPANVYTWNLKDRELPLLGFANARLTPGFELSLAYPLDQLAFPIFQALNYDDERGRYLVPSIGRSGNGIHFIEFATTETRNTYVSIDDRNIKLIDNDNLKTLLTSDGTKYIFVRYPDGEFRCASIKDPSGSYISLLYTANGLMLHGVVDSSGRTITFNYDRDGIKSVTQTWMANSEGLTKTWTAGEQSESLIGTAAKYSHVIMSAKALPRNALIRQYTAEMAASDKMLAQAFGGPNAVAGANGFEPAGLAVAYPFYRGDIIGDDGKERRGHLSYAMHLYGSSDGTGDSPIFIPNGFTMHSGQPSPTDAAMIFYYPRLGNLTDVTLAVFHVADFQIRYETEDRVRIGNIGGPGGSSALYKHSHIEFYRGNTGLPPVASRQHLRIEPATVFAVPAATADQ